MDPLPDARTASRKGRAPGNSEVGDDAGHELAGLGGVVPKDCFILPIMVREKTVCFLYCDNVEDGVGGLPMADLRRLAAKAGLAFQVYIMKSKIRTL